MSHPTGVRGLKLLVTPEAQASLNVAPHWGAWIEICGTCSRLHAHGGRTPLGCVD